MSKRIICNYQNVKKIFSIEPQTTFLEIIDNIKLKFSIHSSKDVKIVHNDYNVEINEAEMFHEGDSVSIVVTNNDLQTEIKENNSDHHTTPIVMN